MEIIKFAPEHLKDFLAQPAQAYARSALAKPEYAQHLAACDSYSAIHDGRVVAVAGVVTMWEGRGDAWALIGQDIGKRGMNAFHYKVRQFLEASPLRRIEAACDATFLEAHRWLELLGFVYEGPLHRYTPEGKDCLRYARLK